MDSKEKYKVIGIMSGTSLDGVDLASCVITRQGGSWAYSLEVAQTVQYSSAWKKRLTAASGMRGDELLSLDIEYGKYLGVLVQAFMMKNKIRGVQFVSSHGHTIFHQPGRRLTFQLGRGNAIYAVCNIPVVCDFRSLDVALGGQGAPLVPVGDKLLFSEYDVCLNLGGIANFSMDVKGKRIAGDICFANMGLNYLAAAAGHTYDKNGKLAADGELHTPLLNDLKKLYQKLHSRRPSLGAELFTTLVKPVLDNYKIDVGDKLATLVESIAWEISMALPAGNKTLTMFCTGGGAFNSYLMYRLVEACGDRVAIIVPEPEIIKFKEAIVFAFLAVLRVRREMNCLKSVTGALKDTSSGVMIGF